MNKKDSALILAFYRCLTPECKLEFIELVKQLSKTDVSKLDTSKGG